MLGVEEDQTTGTTNALDDLLGTVQPSKKEQPKSTGGVADLLDIDYNPSG